MICEMVIADVELFIMVQVALFNSFEKLLTEIEVQGETVFVGGC